MLRPREMQQFVWKWALASAVGRAAMQHACTPVAVIGAQVTSGEDMRGAFARQQPIRSTSACSASKLFGGMRHAPKLAPSTVAASTASVTATWAGMGPTATSQVSAHAGPLLGSCAASAPYPWPRWLADPFPIEACRPISCFPRKERAIMYDTRAASWGCVA